MRILFVYRHFWPDTPPYASMLRSIAGQLAGAGHAVSVWCETPVSGVDAATQPHREFLDGISVTRVKSLPLQRRWAAVKTLAMLLFPLRMLLLAMFRRITGDTHDLVITATNPPILSGLFTLAISRLFGARFIYHCQDIYPELGVSAGLWQADGGAFRTMMRLESWTCSGAERIVTLSEDMRATLEARGISRRKISTVNNFMPYEFTDKSEPCSSMEKPFQLIFAGNIGRFQGLEAVLNVAEALSGDRDIEFLLLGGGSEFGNLRRRYAQLPNIRFARGIPAEHARLQIVGASLGIVCLQAGLTRVAYPSKTLTYLALGVPVLAIVDTECELSRMIESEGVGFACGTGDSAAIARIIQHAYKNRHELGAMRLRARRLYERNFSRVATLLCWEQMATDPAFQP